MRDIENKTEGELMTQEQFEDQINNGLNLLVFDAVRKYKSVVRAYKRGHITKYGFLIPRRPFNNRKRTRGRALNEKKKRIYAQLKDYERRHGEPYHRGL